MSHTAAKRTFVTPVELLRYAIDALEHDPDETGVDKGHPQDSYFTARAALDAIAGMFIAETTRAYREP